MVVPAVLERSWTRSQVWCAPQNGSSCPGGRDATSNQVVLDANGVDHLADKNVGLIPDPDREAVGTAALAAPGEPPNRLGEGEDLVGGQGGCGCLQGDEREDVLNVADVAHPAGRVGVDSG